MKPLYNFGLSQEDERTEATALGIGPEDRVLSIASGGEMPLSLLAMGVAHVDAVDIDPNQLHLVRLKFAAALHLDREEAVRFLGYMTATKRERLRAFDALAPDLPEETRAFWQANRSQLAPGVVWVGRFERYIRLLSRIAVPVMGRRRIEGMFACATLEEQAAYFGRHLDTAFFRGFLRVAFNRKVYSFRGMDKRSLQYRTAKDEALGQQYFRQLRNALTRTPIRENHLLQLMLLGRCLSADHVPHFLSPEGLPVLRANAGRIDFHLSDIVAYLKAIPAGTFDKAHLSNVADWLDQPRFEEVMALVAQKTARPGRAIWRFIHRDRTIPDALRATTVLEPDFGDDLELSDRFPFYGIRPASFPRAESG
jgi:S-adenosylmethionine-diacylglycerol 3-amino-3-carboxypropyl transferase